MLAALVSPADSLVKNLIDHLDDGNRLKGKQRFEYLRQHEEAALLQWMREAVALNRVQDDVQPGCLLISGLALGPFAVRSGYIRLPGWNELLWRWRVRWRWIENLRQSAAHIGTIFKQLLHG